MYWFAEIELHSDSEYLKNYFPDFDWTMHYASFIRPRTIICPVTFGLGVHVEKSFGTK